MGRGNMYAAIVGTLAKCVTRYTRKPAAPFAVDAATPVAVAHQKPNASLWDARSRIATPASTKGRMSKHAAIAQLADAGTASPSIQTDAQRNAKDVAP